MNTKPTKKPRNETPQTIAIRAHRELTKLLEQRERAASKVTEYQARIDQLMADLPAEAAEILKRLG
jgi:hypothetical protein